jgi:hypothetical protein
MASFLFIPQNDYLAYQIFTTFLTNLSDFSTKKKEKDFPLCTLVLEAIYSISFDIPF